MSKRYFTNQMMDYSKPTDETTIKPPFEYLESQIRDIVESILHKYPPNEIQIYEVYLGLAGVAYMFYHLSKNPYLESQRQSHIEYAVSYINAALKLCSQQENTYIPSFLLGYCGVYAVAVVIYFANGDIEESQKYQRLYEESAETCKEFRFLSCGSDELFVGRTGYICGALWISKETSTPLKSHIIHELCQIIVTSGQQYSQSHKSKSPLMYAYYNVEYMGLGHGLSGILQILMSVPDYLNNNPIDQAKVKEAVDYLLSLQDGAGNFPCRTGELNETNDLLHWCHGASGIIYVIASAYLLWKDQRYLKSCEGIGQLIWEKGLLRKGPGLCHGVAGNGYVFLLLYRLTNEEVHLHRAIAFAEFLNNEEFKKSARVPDNPYSLYEGIAGTACYLSDILNPSQAAFPFLDIFSM